MNVDLNYGDALNGIVNEILSSEKLLEEEQQAALTKIGKALQKEVKALLPKSDEHGPGYKHMRDDVKVLIAGKKQKTGVTGVIVNGGKLTAYKWHMLDDGTRNKDGTVHTKAIHFTTQAMKNATPEIEQIMNELERKVAGS